MESLGRKKKLAVEDFKRLRQIRPHRWKPKSFTEDWNFPRSIERGFLKIEKITGGANRSAEEPNAQRKSQNVRQKIQIVRGKQSRTAENRNFIRIPGSSVENSKTPLKIGNFRDSARFPAIPES